MTSPHVRTDETLVNLHAQDRVSSDMVVLIPVKSFATAKARLGPVLGPDERAALARGMAARVIEAAAPAAVWVVCDDEEVAASPASTGPTCVGPRGSASTAPSPRRSPEPSVPGRPKR